MATGVGADVGAGIAWAGTVGARVGATVTGIAVGTGTGTMVGTGTGAMVGVGTTPTRGGHRKEREGPPLDSKRDATG